MQKGERELLRQYAVRALGFDRYTIDRHDIQDAIDVTCEKIESEGGLENRQPWWMIRWKFRSASHAIRRKEACRSRFLEEQSYLASENQRKNAQRPNSEEELEILGRVRKALEDEPGNNDKRDLLELIDERMTPVSKRTTFASLAKRRRCDATRLKKNIEDRFRSLLDRCRGFDGNLEEAPT